MSLSGHLRELKNRILVCLVIFLIVTVIGLNYAQELVELFLELGAACDYEFVYIAPQELLMQYFTVSFVIAGCVTAPILLYEIWAFVSPGLEKNENLLFGMTLVFGLICFVIGVFFAYEIMVPFMLQFFDSLSEGSSVSGTISVEKYIGFILTVLVIFGVVFELPVISVLLNRLGILKVEWMKKARRVVIVVIFVIAALISPPDVVSQIMVAIPMIGLYELSILLCGIFARFFGEKKPKEIEEEAEEEEEEE